MKEYLDLTKEKKMSVGQMIEKSNLMNKVGTKYKLNEIKDYLDKNEKQIKEEYERKKERKTNLKKGVRKVLYKKTPKFLKRKMSYKTGNPLKGLLKTKKVTIKVHGGEPINLFR